MYHYSLLNDSEAFRGAYTNQIVALEAQEAKIAKVLCYKRIDWASVLCSR